MRRFFAILLILFASVSGNCQKAPFNADSLISVLPSIAEDTNKVLLLDKLSYSLYTSNPRQGLKYAQEELELSKKLGWTRGLALAYSELGVNSSALADYHNALQFYEKASSYHKDLDDKNGLAAIDANISLIHSAQGRYPQALEYALKALELKEAIGDEQGKGIILENIGTIFLEQKDYEKTIRYYAKALAVYKKIANKEGIARNTGNMGIVQDAAGNFAAALAYHKEALSLNKQLHNKYSIQINHANISLAYLHLKDYRQALIHQQKALEISRELGSRNSIAVNLGNLGELYFAMAKNSGSATAARSYLDSAIHYLDKAVALCKELSFSGPLIEYEQYLAEAYFEAGMYEKAFLGLKAYTALHDSVFSMQNKLAIEKLETTRELELRDRQLEINQLKLKQKDNERTIYLISIILLLLVTGMSIWLIVKYRRSNSVLQKEKQRHLRKIEEQVNEIKKQADVLEEIAEIQSHDVRGPVATILGLVQLFNMDDYWDPANKVVIEGIHKITDELDIAVQEVVEKKNKYVEEKFAGMDASHPQEA
jgi:tetratricopeptide (TPR) repeat protein